MLALLIALAAVGIDLTVLSVFGGALGVGLGLGLQKIAANYVSGFAILLEGSFRVGDSVKVDNFEGQITNIFYALYGGACGERARIRGAEREVHCQPCGKPVARKSQRFIQHKSAD